MAPRKQKNDASKEKNENASELLLGGDAKGANYPNIITNTKELQATQIDDM